MFCFIFILNNFLKFSTFFTNIQYDFNKKKKVFFKKSLWKSGVSVFYKFRVFLEQMSVWSSPPCSPKWASE